MQPYGGQFSTNKTFLGNMQTNEVCTDLIDPPCTTIGEYLLPAYKVKKGKERGGEKGKFRRESTT